MESILQSQLFSWLGGPIPPVLQWIGIFAALILPVWYLVKLVYLRIAIPLFVKTAPIFAERALIFRLQAEKEARQYSQNSISATAFGQTLIIDTLSSWALMLCGSGISIILLALQSEKLISWILALVLWAIGWYRLNHHSKDLYVLNAMRSPEASIKLIRRITDVLRKYLSNEKIDGLLQQYGIDFDD